MEPIISAGHVAQAWHAHILVLGLLKLLSPFSDMHIFVVLLPCD